MSLREDASHLPLDARPEEPEGPRFVTCESSEHVPTQRASGCRRTCGDEVMGAAAQHTQG
eukprot:14317478-Alexandrium_andersonii.AAC.1